MKWVRRLGVSLATVGFMTFSALLSPPSGLASLVEAVGRDANGTVLLKSGDLTTPVSLPAGSSPAVAIALIGQGVGPIFGSVLFSGSRVSLAPPPFPPRELPTPVPDSLSVSEPPVYGTGLTFGGIAFPQGSGPGTSPAPPSGTVTLVGTVKEGVPATGITGTLVGTVTHANLVPNPLPGAVWLFLTGLGALKLLRRRSRIKSGRDRGTTQTC